MSKKPKTPPAPAPWELHRKTARTDVMPSRVHGQKSRRTERRQAKQKGRCDGWD